MSSLTWQGSRRRWRFKTACTLESGIFGQIPDALTQNIMESQEERYLLRELTGGGENRLF